MRNFNDELDNWAPRLPPGLLQWLSSTLAPFAPHIAEEWWSVLGGTEPVSRQSWLTYNEAALKQSFIEIPVHMNGKLKGMIQVSANADRDAMIAAATADESIRTLIAGKTIVKSIAVPGRMVNLVVK